MATNSAFAPLALYQPTVEDFKTEDGVKAFAQHYSLLTQRLNAVQGNVGKVQFPAGVDMAGQAIENVNGVGVEHSAISHAQAEAKYSAAALSPQLEAGQKNSLRSVRRLNDNAQRENYSQFLEGSLNVSPTTNTATISGGGGTVTVSSGFHLLVSGNVQPFASRTDTLTLPSSVAITSLLRSSSIVTATTTSATGYLPGSVVNVSGVADSSFNGSFVLISAVGTTLTWRQVSPNATTTGGTVSESGVYYYRLPTGARTLALYGPYSSDSQQNRLQTNADGGVLIAVAVFTGGGLDLTQSAAGATPPPANNGAHVLTRL
jgi:hypothetical protein